MAPPRDVTGPRPATVGVVLAAAALAFVVLRLLAHDGDATLFVRAGDEITDARAGTDAGLTVADDSAGYDGQFSYRLARAPLSTAERVDGVGLDRPVDRVARIGYPVLAWAASGGGRRALVPWALVGVNVAAVGVIAGLGAALARDLGRPGWWGALPAAAPGLVVALSRDLTEVVAAAALLGGVVLLRRGRWGPAAAVLVVAALTRETTLVLPLAVLVAGLAVRLPLASGRLADLRARVLGSSPVPTPAAPTAHDASAQAAAEGTGPGVASGAGPTSGGPWRGAVPPVWVGLVPIAAYGAWRTYLSVVWDAPAGVGDPGATTNGLTVPLLRPLGQLASFATSGDVVDLVQLLQLALVLVGVALVALAAWRAAVPGVEKLAVAGAVALLVSLTTWDRAVVFLRYPTDVLVLGAAVLPAVPALAGRAVRVAVPLLALTALMWVGVA